MAAGSQLVTRTATTRGVYAYRGQPTPATRPLSSAGAGAGGGVGTLGLQIAKQYDAEVTGVDSGLKLDMMRKLGFDHVIDYQREDFTRGERRYDLILDAKTTRSPFRYSRALNPGGRYVTVGGDVSRLLQVACVGPLVRLLTSKTARIVALKPNKDLQYLNELFEKKGLEVVIDGLYPLRDVPLL